MLKFDELNPQGSFKNIEKIREITAAIETLTQTYAKQSARTRLDKFKLLMRYALQDNPYLSTGRNPCQQNR